MKPLDQVTKPFRKGINTFVPSMVNEARECCYNILIRYDGTLSPMPFDTKRSGVWYFDGQVFYQKLEFFESMKGKL